MNIAPPANRTFQAVQNWFRPRAESSKREAPFMDKSVLDTLFLNNTDGTKFPYESETMTLHAPAEEDRFSRWIVQWGVLGSFFRVRKFTFCFFLIDHRRYKKKLTLKFTSCTAKTPCIRRVFRRQGKDHPPHRDFFHHAFRPDISRCRRLGFVDPA